MPPAKMRPKTCSLKDGLSDGVHSAIIQIMSFLEKNKIDAIAFDIDGTLYPNHRILPSLVPKVLAHFKLVNAFRKARKIIRKEEFEGSFFDAQAKIISQILNEDEAVCKACVEQLIYRSWCDVFKKIKPFKNVRAVIEHFRSLGLKTAAMSDFPPHEKLRNLGLDGLWDVEIGSEFTGRLKPNPRPFYRLAEALGTPPERILYVGNSVTHDIKGASGVGMKTALIEPVPRLRFHGGALIVFRSYRQLECAVLG
jgi:putative hydrolase of the HAD superfamily